MNTKPSTYVAGFMFSKDLSKVLLIRKLKPVWQRGLLNGVGGKIEEGETPLMAMTREFREEADGDIATEWRHFLNLSGENALGETFSVDFFASKLIHNDLTTFHSQEEEQLEMVDVTTLHALRLDVVENVPWIVALAVDVMNDSPIFVSAWYVKS